MTTVKSRKASPQRDKVNSETPETPIWIGALVGVLFRVLWVTAPRWLYVPIYLALGWVAVFYFGPLMRHGGAAVITLITVGGVLYTAGAVVYGIKRPDPSPRWFGFHEIFHVCTVLAFLCHWTACLLIALQPAYHGG